jgi:hypothetical protein
MCPTEIFHTIVFTTVYISPEQILVCQYPLLITTSSRVLASIRLGFPLDINDRA